MSNDGPITFVLFGSTGDLAERKIMPALCALFLAGRLPEGSSIVAFSRRQWGSEEYRAFIRPSLQAFTKEQVESFLTHVEYAQGTFDEAEAYTRLKEKITTNKAVYHLAVQPEFYEPIVRGLGGAGLTGNLLIEKPFGQDHASALLLEQGVEQYFAPGQIYRVDHYLGKGGLAQLLSERRNDAVFEGSLTHEHITRVTCRLLETIDIQGRGEFYDSTGALKDVGQNHLLSMLAVVLMDLSAQGLEVPHARAQALQLLVLQAGGAVVRGQYEGYRDGPDVQKESQTETYFKVVAESSDARWQGVELVLEAGKCLKEKKSEIEIEYKDGTRRIFAMDTPNARDAYETIIEAALAEDASYFAGIEEVLAGWKFTESVISAFSQAPLAVYTKGSAAADVAASSATMQ